ncbi:MAG: ABC transporter ATP-binding protein [Deltaproteobacteria bacterium]|nr:ABC transporter ATP-binding protein [Deltaproteobacteria bacterium]
MLLESRDLTKAFGGLVAVNQLSMTVEKGTVLGIIGPNGSGKTTFFNLITGMIPSDSGKVIFNGEDITKLRPHRIARLGVGRTFQIPAPFSKMTVLENVMVSSFIHTSSMKIAKKKAWEVLEKVGLDEKADFQVLNVTLEDRKRLELAKALAIEPSLLLLDEVMSGLTPVEVKSAIHLIRQMHRQGLTIIIVEHVMDVILSLCDRVAVLDYGRKIAEGTPQQIVNHPEVIRAYLGERYRARS